MYWQACCCTRSGGAHGRTASDPTSASLKIMCTPWCLVSDLSICCRMEASGRAMRQAKLMLKMVRGCATLAPHALLLSRCQFHMDASPLSACKARHFGSSTLQIPLSIELRGMTIYLQPRTCARLCINIYLGIYIRSCMHQPLRSQGDILSSSRPQSVCTSLCTGCSGK